MYEVSDAKALGARMEAMFQELYPIMKELMLKKPAKSHAHSPCMALALYCNNCKGPHGEAKCALFTEDSDGYQQPRLEEIDALVTNYQRLQGNQYGNPYHSNQGIF